MLKSGHSHYECLKIDELRICVQKKSNMVWLFYVYDQPSGETETYVWGKRNLKTTKALWKKLSESGVAYTVICTDDRPSFVKAIKSDAHTLG